MVQMKRFSSGEKNRGVAGLIVDALRSKTKPSNEAATCAGRRDSVGSAPLTSKDQLEMDGPAERVNQVRVGRSRLLMEEERGKGNDGPR